jgi:hypothetical protein
MFGEAAVKEAEKGDAGLGPWDGFPGTKLTEIVVTLDDKTVRLAAKDLGSCYNPGLVGDGEEKNVSVVLNPRGTAVGIALSGGDSGDGYVAMWRVAKTGRVTSFLELIDSRPPLGRLAALVLTMGGDTLAEDRQAFLKSVKSGSDALVMSLAMRNTPSDEILRDLNEADAEILNGGFHQLFLNDGVDGSRLPGWFREVGAREAAAIAERAVKRFPGGKVPRRGPRSLEERIAQLEKLGIKVGSFKSENEAYYKLNPDVVGMICRYVRGNPKRYWPKR